MGHSYIHTKTPYEDFFQIMQKHKKSTGLLVIAIENKFGLKVLGRLQGRSCGNLFLRTRRDIRREEVPEPSLKGDSEKIFERCGETDYYHFYYPYPDYKFPTTIYSDRRLPV